MARKDFRGGEEAGLGPKLPLWKRLFDMGVIVLATPVLVCVGAGVALVVTCGSRGPALFRQKRIGYKGREFTFYKFRTMHNGAETDSHRQHTQHLIKAQVPMAKLDGQNDPRLIPFGAVLRASGLDELPQVLNILRGDMSLVGPRPCMPYEYELHEEWHRRRFEVMPGLTGLWQVTGKNRTTFEEMVRLDIEYAERLNPWLDLKIILKTPAALWRQYNDMRARKRKEATTARASIKSVESYNL